MSQFNPPQRTFPDSLYMISKSKSKNCRAPTNSNVLKLPRLLFHLVSNYRNPTYLWAHSLAVNKSKSKTVKLQLVQMYSNFQDYCFIWSVTTEIQHLWASFISCSFILLLSIDLKLCNSFSVWFHCKKTTEIISSRSWKQQYQ